jgi:hypothetical protein
MIKNELSTTEENQIHGVQRKRHKTNAIVKYK